jgi:pSer/pThr/pTyr-binding forkhead associated (FHA) protein
MACHTDDVAAAASKDDAAGSCVKCHLYHEHSKSLLGKPAPAFVARLGVQRGVKGDPPTDMLHNVLLIVIALLVLVVFLPVAIAAVRRLATRRDDERPPRNRSLPPTQRVAAIKAPDRSDSGTDKKAKPAASAAPESNPMLTMELALWQGALRCTAGSLAGQVFVIEENGFYIGRDPQLSQVVIDDGRISKRHVRIVPRGQKIYAIDQESTNGTFLASAPEQRITEVVLKPGDEIVLAGDAARFLYSI